MRADLAVLPSAAALADAAAGRFVAAAGDAIASRGQFIVALSGGSTPRDTYLRLGTGALASKVMWSRVQVLWGDERCVPPDDLESNYRMARETLLDRVPVPAANVHRIRGEDDPATAAGVYDTTPRPRSCSSSPAAPKRAFFAECSRGPGVRRSCRRRQSRPPTAECAGAWMQRRPLTSRHEDQSPRRPSGSAGDAARR